MLNSKLSQNLCRGTGITRKQCYYRGNFANTIHLWKNRRCFKPPPP